MKTTLRLTAFAVAAVLAVPLAAQSPRALTHDDYDQWKTLRGTTYRPDGAWVAFQIEPQQGDGVLEIHEVDGTRVHRVPMGQGARFSADGACVVFTIAPSKIAERQKKIEELRKKARKGAAAEEGEKGEKGEKTEGGETRRPGQGGARRPGGAGGAGGNDGDAARERSELAVLDLASGAITKLGKVKGFTLPEEIAVLVYHRDKPEKEAKDGDVADKPLAETGEAPTKAEAPPSAKPAPKKADPLEKKRPEGTDLIVRDLATGAEKTFGDVVAYGTSRKGAWLWFHTSAKTPRDGAKYGVFVVPLASAVATEPAAVFEGIAHVANVTFDRDESMLAFTADRDDFAADKPRSDLWAWRCGEAAATLLAGPGTVGLPTGKRVSGGLSFCRDGSVLAFEVQDAPEADPLPILPEDKVVLDVWNWRDGQLQTQQQKRTGDERNPPLCAVWHRDQRRVQLLGDERLRTLRFLGNDGAWMLGTDGRDYERETTWDGRYVDVWLVNAVDGSRRRVLERLRGNVTPSPGGRYLLWFGPEYHWWSMDVATGTRRDLTGTLPVPFHRTDDDHPEPDDPHGIGGFAADDAAVLLYDEFDVWKVPLATGDAVCVTDGFGRANRLRLRVQPLPRDPEQQYVDTDLMLAATDVDTMAEGFYADALDHQQKPRRLYQACENVAELVRPRRGERLFFTRSTFARFPDLWTSDGAFGELRRLSDANPQQKDYRWGEAELVHWIDGDGARCSGVLIKPDGFDPAKKYPMLVSFYERMSQGLHNHVAPAPGTSPNPTWYVSNGYLWFEPDVRYEIGYPGRSCVKCVVSGVQHLIAQGFVDEKAIGAAGHSWGGYQTAFLVTQTHLFAAVESGAPVCDMLSAYGGIRYESGVSRQFQYEKTQSRIGGTPWQYPLRYVENSPIWFADKVTTPVLILHNDQDGAVPWTQGIEYFTALRRLGKECYLFNYNGEGHGLRQRQNMKDWARRMSEYFAHHLKGAPAPKWMTEGVPYHEREREKLPYAQSYIDAHLSPAPPATRPESVATPREASGTAPGPAPLGKGDAAPAFRARDESGAERSLADYHGRLLLLWFYPRAGTPGCTQQGCGLRDVFAEFDARGCAVVGVSVDDEAANAAFKDAQHFPFPLLCDTDRSLAIAFGAAADANARAAKRVAFLIDGGGRIVHVWRDVDPSTFADAALAALPL